MHANMVNAYKNQPTLGGWYDYIQMLTNVLVAHPDATRVIVVNNRAMTLYARQLSTILQTELYRRTGRLIHQDTLLNIEQSCIGPDYRKTLAERLAKIEQRLEQGATSLLAVV